MERWRGQRALVTGASSGIGYSIADALARNGVKVTACARNIAAIQELAQNHEQGLVEAVECDVTKDDDIKRMFADIEARHSHVDILINNAGIAKLGDLVSGKTDKWRDMLEDISPGVVGETGLMQRAFADAIPEERPNKSRLTASEYQRLTADDVINTVLFVLSAPIHVNFKNIIFCSTQQPEV